MVPRHRLLRKMGQIQTKLAEEVPRVTEGRAKAANGGAKKSSILEEYGINMMKLAPEGKVYPPVAWESQIQSLLDVFRCSNRHECLVGHPGVGKTATVKELAQRMATGNVPEMLKGKEVIALDMNLLSAAKRDYRETKELFMLIEEIEQSENVILFIDDVHNFLGAKAQLSFCAAYCLEFFLADSKLQCIV